MRVGVAVLGLLLVAGEAEAADQFDLVCKGELKKGIGAQPEPYQQRFRVDLPKGQWCDGGCNNVRRIVEVSPTRITLVQRDEPHKRESELHIVERTSGEWFHSIEGNGDTWTIKGTCDSAQFSGINPATKF